MSKVIELRNDEERSERINERRKVYGYIRVSTGKQDLGNQRLEILTYANKNDLKIDDFIEVSVSSRVNNKKRRIDELISRMNPGDLLIVSEMSRLGRSLGNVVQIMDELMELKVDFISIKEGIKIVSQNKKDIQTTIMITLFSLFSEIERNLISERTIQGLLNAKNKGKQLGRPKGSYGKSKLDGKIKEVENYLSLGLNVTAIAKLMKTSRGCLYNFLKKNNLKNN
jgi:DNA invertase Pin-like site-specific DNA recombinase